ncbi:AAA family ATPase [Thermophilibacter sp.]|uniref:AAA family ATPase n=1 Tax=Thermophilibacter sp. TaxID=2847309 RepID=UPI003A94C8BC
MELVLRLKSLELRNFHRFEKFSIDFDDYLTVLIGNNGSGKSSLLSAAAVAVGTLFIKFDDIPTRSILRSDARVKTFDYGETIDL